MSTQGKENTLVHWVSDGRGGYNSVDHRQKPSKKSGGLKDQSGLPPPVWLVNPKGVEASIASWKPFEDDAGNLTSPGSTAQQQEQSGEAAADAPGAIIRSMTCFFCRSIPSEFLRLFYIDKQPFGILSICRRSNCYFIICSVAQFLN